MNWSSIIKEHLEEYMDTANPIKSSVYELTLYELVVLKMIERKTGEVEDSHIVKLIGTDYEKVINRLCFDGLVELRDGAYCITDRGCTVLDYDSLPF